MSQEDLTAVLQRYGYFTNEGQPLKKWIDAGLFDKEKQFYINTKAGKELFEKIIDKRHRYENYQIKQLLIEKGFSEDEISFDKTLIILNGMKYKCFTSSDLKEIDKTQFDNIEQLYLNLNLCRLSGQIKNNEVKEQEKTDKEDDNFEDIDETDFDDSKWNDDDDNDETNDDEQIKICPSCKTQMEPKVFICPKCGLRCGAGTIRNKTDLEIDKKIDEFKKQFQEKIDKDYNGINLDLNWDWDINLLIDKISESIQKHSSSDLKQYLRDYTEKPMCKDIKTEYDKAMNICCCSDIILGILNGLKEVFKEDEIALEHIGKCYRSIDQLQYEKTKLAEKLKPAENEDELSFDNDKDSDNDGFNFDDDEGDDEEFNFDDDDDEIEEVNDNSKNINNILRMKQAIINEFINDEYLDSDEVEELIEYVADLLIDNNISKLQDFFEDLLIKSKADKTIESIQRILLLHQVFYIAANTCDNMAKVLNSKSINSFIDELHNYYYVRFQQKMKEASEVANKIKAKQNWKKVGKMLLTGFALPFIGYIKMGEALDSYNSRPEVQEKRRLEQEKRAAEEKQRNIKYYCVYCGLPFPSVMALRNATCSMHPNGVGKGKHELYEGSQKSTYYCKYCGLPFPSLLSLCNATCSQHPYGVGKGKHSPAL